MLKEKLITIVSENGQIIEGIFDKNNKIGDTYWLYLSSKDDQKLKLFCLIDKNKNIIIPPIKKELISSFSTNDKNDICIELKDNEENKSIYYHYQKQDNNYHNVFSTETRSKITFSIQKTILDDYWFIQSSNDTRCLYNPKLVKQITPFFNDICIIENSTSPHLANFYKDIYIKDLESEIKVLATTLVGFIGYNGEFSSRIYDTSPTIYQNQGQRYYAIKESGREGMFHFQNLCENLAISYENYFEEQEIINNQILDELFHELIVPVDTPNLKKPAKILQFSKKGD